MFVVLSFFAGEFFLQRGGGCRGGTERDGTERGGTERGGTERGRHGSGVGAERGRYEEEAVRVGSRSGAERGIA